MFNDAMNELLLKDSRRSFNETLIHPPSVRSPSRWLKVVEVVNWSTGARTLLPSSDILITYHATIPESTEYYSEYKLMFGGGIIKGLAAFFTRCTVFLVPEKAKPNYQQLCIHKARNREYIKIKLLSSGLLKIGPPQEPKTMNAGDR